eukprot:scaffold77848_cov65-Phaeocystis_antarctica.AAC.2
MREHRFPYSCFRFRAPSSPGFSQPASNELLLLESEAAPDVGRCGNLWPRHEAEVGPRHTRTQTPPGEGEEGSLFERQCTHGEPDCPVVAAS